MAAPLMMKSCEKIPDHVDKPETIEMALRRTHKDAMKKQYDIQRGYELALDHNVMRPLGKRKSFSTIFQMDEIEYHRYLLRSVFASGMEGWESNAITLRIFLDTINKYLDENVKDKQKHLADFIRMSIHLNIKNYPHESAFWEQFNQFSTEKFGGNAKTFSDSISIYLKVFDGPLRPYIGQSNIGLMTADIIKYQSTYAR